MEELGSLHPTSLMDTSNPPALFPTEDELISSAARLEDKFLEPNAVDTEIAPSELTLEQNHTKNASPSAAEELDTAKEAADDEVVESKPDTVEEANDTPNDVQNDETKVEPMEPEVEKKPPPPKLDPEQCRVCQSKESLVYIFDVRGDMSIAQYIVELCPNLKISAHDVLPQRICNSCTDSVLLAHAFKKKCESTDKSFRSQLRRSQIKKRAPSDYVLLDASKDLPSSSEDEEAVQDDEEFKVSESDEVLDSDDDEDEDFTPKKKKKTPKAPKPKKREIKKAEKKQKTTKGPGRPAKYKKTSPVSAVKEKPLTKNVVYIEALDSSSGGDDDEVVSSKPKKRKMTPKIQARKKEDAQYTPKYKAASSKAYSTSKPSAGVTRQKHKRPETQEVSGRDLFRTCAPPTTTYWSDSFSD